MIITCDFSTWGHAARAAAGTPRRMLVPLLELEWDALFAGNTTMGVPSGACAYMFE